MGDVDFSKIAAAGFGVSDVALSQVAAAGFDATDVSLSDVAAAGFNATDIALSDVAAAGFSVDQLAGLTQPDGRDTFSDTDLLGAFSVEALLASDTFKDDLSFLSEQGLNQELVAAGFADELYQQGLGAELLADVGVQALAEGISVAKGIRLNAFETIDTTVGFINENEEFDLDALVGVFADEVLVNYARAMELKLPADSKLGALVAAQRG